MNKHMKKLILMAAAIGIMMPAFTQDYIPTPAEVEHFYKTKTLVVLNGNPMSEFNLIAKDVMKNHWTLTPYDFCSRDEFEEKRYDENYSFILMNPVRFENDKTNAKYNFLSLLLGGKERIVGNMPDLCPVPISYAGVEEESYTYKLGAILRFMQNHVEYLHNHPNYIKESVFKRYNEHMGEVHDKTLYLLPEELEKTINTEAKIKKIYPYPFKLVTKEDIEEAINKQDTSVVFLNKVGPEGTKVDARVYKIIVGAGNANFYFFSFHKLSDKQPDAFLMSDLKKLATATKKKIK
jgi:hypothetical protein